MKKENRIYARVSKSYASPNIEKNLSAGNTNKTRIDPTSEQHSTKDPFLEPDR